MTAQLLDTVCFDGQRFDLVRVDGRGLFEPAAFGLSVVMASTAAWRGYVCAYEIVDDQLELKQLEAMVGRYDNDRFVVVPPVLLHDREGMPAQGMFNTCYTDLGLPVLYTGKLTLGADRTGEPDAVVDAELYCRLFACVLTRVGWSPALELIMAHGKSTVPTTSNQHHTMGLDM